MVKLKNKSHYSLNPADRERKKQRRKEIERNRRERKFNRDASSKKDNPEDLKAELEELLGKEEESGKLNQVDRLRKKVLQDQLKIAIKEQHHARTGTDTSKGFDPVLFSRAQTGAAEPSAAAVDAAVAAPSPEAAAPSADAELLPPPGRPFGLLPPPATAPPAAAAIAYGRPAMPPPMRRRPSRRRPRAARPRAQRCRRPLRRPRSPRGSRRRSARSSARAAPSSRPTRTRRYWRSSRRTSRRRGPA
ncbi:unnamed protein product [Pedinophyceae sp. YPF-701]|nr:unnamed protein product [Pedinophyceae sp. YPF-701]